MQRMNYKKIHLFWLYYFEREVIFAFNYKHK